VKRLEVLSLWATGVEGGRAILPGGGKGGAAAKAGAVCCAIRLALFGSRTP